MLQTKNITELLWGDLNNLTELSVGGWFVKVSISSIRRVLQVVRGNCGIPLLIRALH